MNDDETRAVKPGWLAPLFVFVVIVAVLMAASKKREAAENPVVDGAVLTVIVFAFAWLFRKVFSMLDAPGAVAFFGGPLQPNPGHADTVDMAEAY